MREVSTLDIDACIAMKSWYVERAIIQIKRIVLVVTVPNMAIRCSMIGSTKHTSLREADRLDDPPKQASEIVISPTTSNI